MVNLGRAYHRQTSYRTAGGQTTRELYKQIYLRESYNQKESWDGAQQEQEVDDLFQHALEMRISEAADQNTKNNDRRSDRLELDTDLSGEPVSWVVQD